MSRPHRLGRPLRSRTDVSHMRTQLIHGTGDRKRWSASITSCHRCQRPWPLVWARCIAVQEPSWHHGHARGQAPEQPVRVFCQDENRPGLHLSAHRRVTGYGVKPIQVVEPLYKFLCELPRLRVF